MAEHQTGIKAGKTAWEVFGARGGSLEEKQAGLCLEVRGYVT